MTAFGAFGKMPALGDFFRFGLAPDFVGPWDTWLQGGLLAARSALGPNWDRSYLTAPIWRFTLARGVCGSDGMQGVLMASVDRVGRQFPLTLARRLAPGVEPLIAHLSAGAAERFAAIETIALSALDDDATRDGLAERLRQLDRALPPAGPVAAVAERAEGFIRLDAGRDPAGDLAAALAGGCFARPAVFTALCDTGQRLILSEGLPAAHRLKCFFELDSEVPA